ncbi:NnrS family protein [Bradyrhizobium sp. 41S5]|nr:NnrS family protein [Bradyrhizobium sp. 41S5]
MPVGFNRFDVVAIGISALALLRWITWPDARTTSILLAAAGFIQLARLARWVGERTWRKVA